MDNVWNTSECSIRNPTPTLKQYNNMSLTWLYIKPFKTDLESFK